MVGVPSGKINTIEQVFQHPQVLARNMVVETDHPTAGSVKLAGIPLDLSRTPAAVRTAPPLLGEHTESVLKEILCKSDAEIESLRERGVV
ncbi:MAG TPA: CoA transferase [Thermomicrobiales bacterium]|nr:CoA transferase [Thermomicrobiales bacterium]